MLFSNIYDLCMMIISVAFVQCEALLNQVTYKSVSFHCAFTLLLLRGTHTQNKWIFNLADVATMISALLARRQYYLHHQAA